MAIKEELYTDEQLVALFVQTQQNHYFGLLYVRCIGTVYRQCVSLMGDPVEAQDLAHEIFIKLMIKLPAFKAKSSFSKWLSKVTYNRCMDELNRRKRKAEIFTRGFSYDPNIADSEDLFGSDADTRICQMTNALMCLSPDENIMLSMKYVDGSNILDVARRFDLTVSAVKMRLMRSRNKLRQRLSKDRIFIKKSLDSAASKC